MNKDQTIQKMIESGWVRHNGTEYGDRGEKAKGKQHKTSSKIGLSECRSINAWLRTQDDYWIAPDGQILNWREYQSYTPTIEKKLSYENRRRYFKYSTQLNSLTEP
jgi:hypothetical protein